MALLHGDVHETFDLVCDGLDLPGDPAEIAEIGPEHADRNRGARAGEHVVDAVADRLPYRDAGPRHPGEPLAHVGHDLGQLVVVKVELRFHVRHVDALRLFVQFGPARASRGRDHCRCPE